MSRTNIVKCKTQEEKKVIAEGWDVIQGESKTSYAKRNNISTRTLNRILGEFQEAVTFDYVVTKNQITILCGEEERSITKGYPKFNKFKKKLIKSDFSEKVLKEVYKLMYFPEFVETFSEGNITVNHEEGKVYYGTFEIKNSLANHMMTILNEGEDVKPFCKFVDMLMANPKPDIVEELYGFMKHNGITIDDDGFIIAYKGVNGDYKDCWSGTISNKIGEHPVMPRSEVVHNPESGCGVGLHAGSLSYAEGWSEGHVMVVKINPSDVCSVPWCTDSQKMRTCGYEVIGEVE